MSSDKAKKNVSKGRFVPSRYKQAAEKVAYQASKDTTKLSTNLTSQPFQASTTQISNPNCTTLSLKSSDSGNYSQIQITSTPANKFKEMPPIDASSISVIDQSFAPIKMKENLLPKRNLKFKKTYDKGSTTCMPMIVLPEEKNSSEVHYSDEAAEEELDILYAQYLQAAFLESQAKLNLKMRSKNVLETVYKVWSLIQVSMEKDKDYDKNIDQITYMINLHKYLCEEEKILQPILEMFPAILDQYKTLAEAVDCVRHKLVIDGISPLDSVTEEEIVNLLEIFHSSLEEFLGTLPDTTCLSHTADSLSSFVSHGENIYQEINRCTDSLCEADDLLVSETSLLMSTHQLKDPNSLN